MLLRAVRHWTYSVPLIVIALVVAIISVMWGGGIGGQQSSTRTSQVVIGDGLDEFESLTARDWVVKADHVIVATVTNEVELPPAPQEVKLGEGLTGGRLTLSVDQVLWTSSAPNTPPLSKMIAMDAVGWTFAGGVDNRSEFAVGNRARLEVNHRYVMALVAEACAAGTSWSTLGEYSVVPFDADVLGAGEFEGVPVEQQPLESKMRAADPGSLRESVLGNKPEAIIRQLRDVSAASTGTSSAANVECGEG